nr:hypothetical protein [uncultured Flavobacterium sp.]
MNKSNKQKEEDKIISLQKLMICVSIIWGISAWLCWWCFSDWSKSGTFGDTFGAINSLFSGLALAGIIYTIYLQKIELGLQRKELEYTRDELTRTADAQEKSVFMMTEQLRLSNLPFLQYNSKVINGKDSLIIYNESEHPAFDLDIWLFITESEENYKHKQFLEDWVTEEDRAKLKIELIDEEIWGISERGIYHSFPKSKKIVIPIDYPVEDDSFEIYIQYRDNLGNNYSQSIWFLNQRDILKPFQDAIYKPSFPTVSERIDLTDENLTEDELPQIAKELVNLKKASVMGSYLINRNFNGVEYRWEMSDV